MKIALIPTRQIAAAITHPRPGWTERAVNCAWQPSLWSSCCPPGARKTSLLCWGCRAQLPLRDDLASSTECRRERGLGTWNSVTGYWARGKGTQKSLQRHLKRGRYESGFIVKAGLFEGGNYLNSPTLCHTPIVTKGALAPQGWLAIAALGCPQRPLGTFQAHLLLFGHGTRRRIHSHILQIWYSGSAGKELVCRAPSPAEPPTQR